jgi:hypothetical protein
MSILPSATMAALMNSFPITELREDKEPCNTTYGSMKKLLKSQNPTNTTKSEEYS